MSKGLRERLPLAGENRGIEVKYAMFDHPVFKRHRRKGNLVAALYEMGEDLACAFAALLNEIGNIPAGRQKAVVLGHRQPARLIVVVQRRNFVGASNVK